jgi:chromatin assembly factor 1 subunit A
MFSGTWSKKSSIISPRNPFQKDNKLLDYEYDSEAEWEEDEEGEECNSDEGDQEDYSSDEEEEDVSHNIARSYCLM